MNNTEPTSKTLRIRSIKHLALILGNTQKEICSLSENTAVYYRDFYREIKGKVRHLVESKGKLKLIQRRILDRILRNLLPFESSFGAIKGKSIKDNAMVHARSPFVAKVDVKDFYPSIHRKKVYDFFRVQDCSPDVARLLTIFTTRKHSLPLGTSTSPMLADQIVRKIDRRIWGISKKLGIKYSRYVDDITLSGHFPLDRLVKLVSQILKQSGFNIKKEKIVFYRPQDESHERIITGVSIHKGMLTAPIDYVLNLKTELQDAVEQSHTGIIKRQFYPQAHYLGQIHFVAWLDPKLKGRLMKLYRKVRWRNLAQISSEGKPIQ